VGRTVNGAGRKAELAIWWWILITKLRNLKGHHPLIIATREAEIGRMEVPGQLRQITRDILSQLIAGCSGARLWSQLPGRLRLGGLQFQVSPSKKSLCDPSQWNKARCGVAWPDIPETSRKLKTGGSWSRPFWGESETLSPK
jgi:hypothetical protein